MQKSILGFQISPFWRGHFFLFDVPKVKTYLPRQGFKMLLVFIFVEIILRQAIFFSSKWFEITGKYWWVAANVVFLTILTYFLVKNFVKIKISQIGLQNWENWSKTEKLYFLQIIPITIIVFSYFTFPQLKVLFARPNLLTICFFNCLPQIIWGFYQEFLYRGILQTELVRRFQNWKGILISNLIFTFGPLHYYHFHLAAKNPAHLWLFVGIFSIGLFFGIIFKRSNNLWIIGIMHGLGDLFLNGLSKI